VSYIFPATKVANEKQNEIKDWKPKVVVDPIILLVTKYLALGF
jgi:hypothetical protein